MIGIDKNIPVPPSRRGSGKSVYPFDKMELGDSFFVPKKKQSIMAAYARVVGKRKGMKFITRVEADGVRVWRVG